MSWFDSLAPAEAAVPCGTGTHTVRWEGGRLSLPAHPDAEAEAVLGALGGDKPGCVTLAETWARHTEDLGVLTAGPRCGADRVSVAWAEIAEMRGDLPRHPAIPGKVARALRYGSTGSGQIWPGAGRPVQPWPRLAPPTGTGQDDMYRRRLQQIERLELLALGAEFQFRLAGTVTAAWAEPERAQQRASRGPELAGVLTGRFALAARDWAGIDPDAVTVTSYEGPGWGTLEVPKSSASSGRDDPPAPPRKGSASSGGDDPPAPPRRTERGRRLRASLPLGWLAGVWACGLAVVDGYLVVAVERPGYPDARVLALATPDSEPVSLEAHATGRSAGGLMTWTF